MSVVGYICYSALKLSVYKLTDTRQTVREAYYCLLKLIPVDMASR